MVAVNSSGPNSTDDVQDTQPQRQVDAAAVGSGIVEAAPTLHPAAAVFRDKILGNVGARIKALEKNNARIRHLVDLIQEVELVFHTTSTSRGQGEQENVTRITYHETLKLKNKLSRGSIEAFDDEEERLVLPIEDAPAQPVEDCGSIGFVDFMLAGVSLGSIGSFFRETSSSVRVIVDEDDSVRLIFHLSEQTIIEGKLHSSLLSNEELIKCTEEPNFITFLTTPLNLGFLGRMFFEGAGEHRKEIVFTPLTISIKVTPWLKKTLALVDQTSSPHRLRSEELKSDDELRRLVVDALGDSEHKELFSEYVALKNDNNILSELRNMMLGVNVRHSKGSFTVNLDMGEKSGDFWYIPLDTSAITVAELSRMEVSVFGMQPNLSNGWELTRASSLIDHDSNTWALWFMHFEATSDLKFYLVVRFNWADFDVDEIRKILEDYTSKMRNALGLNNNAATEDVFPSSFEANVVAICWDLPLAEHRLKMAGLWDEDEE